MIEVLDKKEDLQTGKPQFQSMHSESEDESSKKDVETTPEVPKKEVKKEIKKEKPKIEVPKKEEPPKKVVNKVPKKKWTCKLGSPSFSPGAAKSKIISVTEKSESSEEELSLDSHALDDVIESEYKKALKKDKSKSDMDKLKKELITYLTK